MVFPLGRLQRPRQRLSIERLASGLSHSIDFFVSYDKLPAMSLSVIGRSVTVDIGERPTLAFILATRSGMELPLKPAKCGRLTVHIDFADAYELEIRADAVRDVLAHLFLDQAGRLCLDLPGNVRSASFIPADQLYPKSRDSPVCEHCHSRAVMPCDFGCDFGYILLRRACWR